MHYLMWSDSVDESAYWNDYVKVNELFAEEAIKHYKEGDISKKEYTQLIYILTVTDFLE